MKKSVFFRLFACVLAAVLLLLSCTACTKTVQKADFYSEYSIKSKAVLKTADGAEVKSTFKGVDGDYIDIAFPETVSVNTLVLSEKGNNILEFEILVSENGEFRSVYQQDLVGELRYCAFNDVLTDTVRVKISKTREGSFEIADTDILFVKHNREDFRITSYAVAKYMQSPDSIDPAHMEVITDMILFGAVVFDTSGHIQYNAFEIDGESVSGEEVLRTAINNIRAASGDHVPNLYINILGPDGDVDTKEEKHNIVFKEYADTLCSELKSMLEEFGADGVYFDYEYPYKSSGWRAFSKFLVQLDETLGEKKIGAALGPWGGSLSDAAKDAVDYYDVMTYDMFDDDGYHATFMTGVDGVNFIQKKGYDLQKSALGVPFYGRPTDRSAVWTNYADCAETLGKFGNVDAAPIEVTVWENEQNVTKTIDTPRYLNSYQMIYDKTAFAYDYGMGGMMIWHYSCDAKSDTGLSLFMAMEEAMESRQA